MKIHPIVATLLIAGIIVLVFSLVKGCNNNKAKDAQLIDYKGRITKLEQDSIDNAKNDKAYNDSMELSNGQLALSKNKELSLTENLERANMRIATLLNSHVPIQPSVDTSFVAVPNLYVDDCEGCFSELKNGQQLVLKYKAEKDNQEQIYKGQLNAKDSRIKYLELANNKIGKDYRSLLDSGSKQAPELRRTLFVSIGAMSINQPLPNAVGLGLLYEDKRRRVFGAHYYVGAYGAIYQAQIAAPLSLRRKK